MTKRGPTPSLIGGTHGTASFHTAGKKFECRRCNEAITKGTRCVRVAKPGTMGSGAAYCMSCFAEVLDQTQRKLDELRAQLDSTGQTA